MYIIIREENSKMKWWNLPKIENKTYFNKVSEEEKPK